MRSSVQVVFVFQQQVNWQPRPPGLELVVQNQIGVEKVRQEVKNIVAVGIGGVRHTVRRKGAVRDVGQTRTLRRLAAGALGVDRESGRRRIRGNDDARSGGVHLKRARVEQRILITPVQDRK